MSCEVLSVDLNFNFLNVSQAHKRKFELLEDDEEDHGFGNEEKGTAKNIGIVKIRGMLFF